jgi:hypothetical protein
MTVTKRPTHTAYCIIGEKGRWREIGAAWATTDGKDFVIHLDCFPKDGKVVLREPERK